MSGEPRAERAKLSKKAVDHARNFLSALFMGLRTAQIHDPANRAFENAVQVLANAARDLYSTTGGFQIQFVEESVFLNGVRLRFADGAFTSMRTLRTLLESKELGGIEMRTAPTIDSVRKLILLFASRPGEGVSKDELQGAQIGLLGVQRYGDGARNIKVDRRLFAAQSYAKLVLALREQLERTRAAREVDWAGGGSGGAPRLRAVRVIQDLVELGSDRADFLLRLSANNKGASRLELYAVNSCLLSVGLGHGLGLPRADLVDLAMAALFHVLGARVTADRWALGETELRSSLAWLVGESGLSRSAHLRTLIVGELVPQASGRPKPHWYTRLLQVAAGFQRLVLAPFEDDGPPLLPLEALGRLAENREGRYDPRAVDLLINVLRAYPVGSEVVLDGGEVGLVVSHAGGSRWDRPVLRVLGDPPRTLDLMVREGGRFLHRIQGTRHFLGDKTAHTTLDELGFPPLLDTEALRALGIEETGNLGTPELDAAPAALDELLDALDLPGDEDDPPLIADDAVEPLSSTEPESPPPELPGSAFDTAPPGDPAWVLPDQPDATGPNSTMPGARVELEFAASDDLPVAPLSPLTPEPLAGGDAEDDGRTPLEPEAIAPAAEAAQAFADPVPAGDLAAENASLRSYIEVLVGALTASNLPVPAPPLPFAPGGDTLPPGRDDSTRPLVPREPGPRPAPAPRRARRPIPPRR